MKYYQLKIINFARANLRLWEQIDGKVNKELSFIDLQQIQHKIFDQRIKKYEQTQIWDECIQQRLFHVHRSQRLSLLRGNRAKKLYILHKGCQIFCIFTRQLQQFFYKNLTKNKTGRHNDYRFVSKCWGEFNFVKTLSTAIIYNDIQLIDNQWKIIAQNGYSEVFEANSLFIKDSLLYYKVSLNDLEFGILSTDLAIKLGDNINEQNTFKWENNIYQL